ncbi:hypothetical protein Egran_01358, partial [Elaphomyces granulatus]
AALRENLINGEVLLNDVDKDILREDLGLRALGHRSTVLTAIRYLRQLSVKYQRANSAKINVYDDLQLIKSPIYSPSVPPGHGPGLPFQRSSFSFSAPSPLQAPPLASAVHTTQDPETEVNRGEKMPDESPTMQVMNEFVETQRVVEDMSKNVYPSETPVPDDEQMVPSNDLPHLRSHEYYVVDKQGKKRRKLELSNPAGTMQLVLRKGGDNHTPIAMGSRQWYMGPDKIAATGLFYPEVEGQDDECGSFLIVSPRFPTAQRLFVKGCLHHFYRQQPVNLGQDKECKRSAIFPCRKSSLESGQPEIFTLYTSRNGKVSVTKEDAAHWPQLNRKGETDLLKNPQNKDPYDYLIDKYPAKDSDEDAYPLYGESGSEGEYDQDTWREMEEEHHGPPQEKSKYLTVDEVDSIMARYIKNCEERWQTAHLPKELRRARRLWLTAKKNKIRNLQIKVLVRDVEQLEKRLKKIQQAIREQEDTKVADLEVQCQSMEQTIFNIEAQRWRISVLEQENCPPRMPVTPRRRQAKPKRQADEESLHSESSDYSSDSLQSFIDDELEDNRTSLTHPSSPDAQQFLVSDQSDTSSESDSEVPISIRRRKGKLRMGVAPSPNGDPKVVITNALPNTKPVPQSSPSPYMRVGDLTVEYIDLTRSSSESPEEDFAIETPPLNPVRPSRDNEAIPTLKIEQPPSPRSTVTPHRTLGREVLKDALPDPSDIRGISRLSWDLLEEQQDRQRLLTKLIVSLPDDEREQMAKFLPSVSRPELKRLMRQALKEILLSDANRGLDPTESKILPMRVASLYISWVNCVSLNERGILKKHVNRALADDDGFDDFADRLSSRLKHYYTTLKASSTTESSVPTEEESDQDLQLASAHTPHKKRKREVKESQEVKRNHESAQLRVALQEEQRKRLEWKMQSMGVGNNDPELQAITFVNPIIYLDSHIGQRVKPHQLSGIQFMWRELIQDKMRQGCLLAHTMGLGKTMQVISLLVSISAAAASADVSIQNQIPSYFHHSQTLVLCPSSLIENWYEEFLMWTPRKNYLGPLRKITASNTTQERLRELSAWDAEGGILIMSYDIFRTWVSNKEHKKRGKPLEEKTHVLVKKQLLEGPNIIVADEAHKMKNRNAGIAAATSGFLSKSRIALTGSPLANNLVDYFSMVDWIAPGYLGKFVEFKANYVEPIEEGLYVDSTYTERRKSLKKLQVLKEILNPKVNRADISVLEGSLPPKVEFVITVPLTDLQENAYNTYVTSLLEGDQKGDVGNARLWTWLAILSLCCNHPACFHDKLLSQANGRKSYQKTDDFDCQEIAGDESVTQAGLSESMIASQKELFAKIPDLKSPDLSHRAQILDKIISESVKAGDKVLVFSHSIPTLDYIEHVLTITNRKFSRLDGSTPIATRQAATKSFSQSDSEQVYLISTRAGGLGLNIPGANRVIIFDFSFSPTWEEQAVGRAYRLGQQKPVFVYRFIAGGSFEEVMYNKAVFKTQLAFRVVDKKNPIRCASRSLKDYLFLVKPVQDEDISKYKGKDPHVLDKILVSDHQRIIRKIALTETFQKEDNDKLTDEEKRDVQEQLDDEILKRNDPEAYDRKMRVKHDAMYLRGPLSIVDPPRHYYPPSMITAGNSLPGLELTIPYGPPPLRPDALNPQVPPTLAGSAAAAAAAMASISSMDNLAEVEINNPNPEASESRSRLGSQPSLVTPLQEQHNLPANGSASPVRTASPAKAGSSCAPQ